MKKYFLILLIFLGCQNSKYIWYNGDFESAKSISNSKLIMIDFYTDT